MLGFPASPTTGEQFGGWVWDGDKWYVPPPSGAPPGGVQDIFTGTGISGDQTTGDISLSLTSPMAITNGGTGQTTAFAARTPAGLDMNRFYITFFFAGLQNNSSSQRVVFREQCQFAMGPMTNIMAVPRTPNPAGTGSQTLNMGWYPAGTNTRNGLWTLIVSNVGSSSPGFNAQQFNGGDVLEMIMFPPASGTVGMSDVTVLVGPILRTT